MESCQCWTLTKRLVMVVQVAVTNSSTRIMDVLSLEDEAMHLTSLIQVDGGALHKDLQIVCVLVVFINAGRQDREVLEAHTW